MNAQQSVKSENWTYKPLSILPSNQVQPCICGCNHEFIFKKRLPDWQFDEIINNFYKVLRHWAKQNQDSFLLKNLEGDPEFLGSPLSLYKLFHLVLAKPAHSWRRIVKKLGWKKVPLHGPKTIEMIYNNLLRRFTSYLKLNPVQVTVLPPMVVPPREDIKLPVKRSAEEMSSDKSASTDSEHEVKEPNPLSQIFFDMLPKSPKEDTSVSTPPNDKNTTQPTTPTPKKQPPVINLDSDSEPTPPKLPFRVIRPKVAKNAVVKTKTATTKTPKRKDIPKPKLVSLPDASTPNPYDPQFRHHTSDFYGFRTNFKLGYSPISMQQAEIDAEQSATRSSKHLIRRKQSSLNIKRSCGVTYIVETESKQKNVDYEKLGHLGYQVGTLDRAKLTVDEEAIYKAKADAIIARQSESYFLLTSFKGEEQQIKEYILNKKSVQEYVIYGFQPLWRLFMEGNFVCIHLDNHLNPCFDIDQSTMSIGCIIRKGICGNRSLKRATGEKLDPDDPTNIQASTIRMELFVSKDFWTKAKEKTQKLLCVYIATLELELSNRIVSWNKLKIEKTPPYMHLYIIKRKCDCPCFTVPTCALCGLHTLETEPSLNSCTNKRPFYFINTRDSFSFDLHTKEEKVVLENGRTAKKVVYYFNKKDVPKNFKDIERFSEGDYVRAGIVSYHKYFTEEEMKAIENNCDNWEKAFLKGRYLINTGQPTYGRGGKLKRTKFFFGTRYMWTACQLAEPMSDVAGGVRVDVSETPVEFKNTVVEPLENAGIIEKDFINSVAMNIYHDGTEGLAQHFDDAVRFKQPIYTLRLYSDSRLSFGSQLYGFCNGAFTIPLPRGCICVMEEFSYAANWVKHCIRPVDMQGRSAAIILRQIHKNIMEEAKRFDLEVDLPSWMSTLSMNEDAVPYYKQKQMDATRRKNDKSIIDEVKTCLNNVIGKVVKRLKNNQRLITQIIVSISSSQWQQLGLRPHLWPPGPHYFRQVESDQKQMQGLSYEMVPVLKIWSLAYVLSQDIAWPATAGYACVEGFQLQSFLVGGILHRTFNLIKDLNPNFHSKMGFIRLFVTIQDHKLLYKATPTYSILDVMKETWEIMKQMHGKDIRGVYVELDGFRIPQSYIVQDVLCQDDKITIGVKYDKPKTRPEKKRKRDQKANKPPASVVSLENTPNTGGFAKPDHTPKQLDSAIKVETPAPEIPAKRVRDVSPSPQQLFMQVFEDSDSESDHSV